MSKHVHYRIKSGRYNCGVGNRWPSMDITSTRSIELVTCRNCIRTAAVVKMAHLSGVEHECISKLAEAINLMASIIEDGETRDFDMGEAVLHIHALQNMVLSQAARRMYPDRYRMLGSRIGG